MRTLRYLPLILCALAAPARADLLPANTPIPDAVDHYIEAPWKEQKVTPAPLADDATFIRRVTLDLNGRIPTAAEVAAYTAATDPKKKEKLVDRLLASPAYVRHQATEFDTSFMVEQGKRGQGTMRDYLRRAFAENRSWDRIFRDVIVADEKDPAAKGAGAFLKSRVKDMDRLTTDVSILFFGVNISCAQCHDHPIVPDWKQDHYYGMKSFFSRTYEAGQFLGEAEYAVVGFKTTKNESKTATLMFLTGKKVEDPSEKLSAAEKKKLAEEAAKKQGRNGRGKGDASRPQAPKFSARAALAELALQKEQRDFFARAIVNRMWHRFLGQGLVNPIDQMHSENTPTHPELLEWLARDTSENKYDLKRMIRGLVLSKTYARSTQYPSEKQPAPRTYAVARLRAMTPTQLATSLRIATYDPEYFGASVKPEEIEKRIEGVENAMRGLASSFEQPRDDFQISVSEALLFSNSERIQREILTEGGGSLLGKMKDAKTPEAAVELAYRTVMARAASEEEKKSLVAHVQVRRDKAAEAYKQIVWALLSSAEFRFNY